MADTAAYYADKLVTFSNFDREAVLLLAKVTGSERKPRVFAPTRPFLNQNCASRQCVLIEVEAEGGNAHARRYLREGDKATAMEAGEGTYIRRSKHAMGCTTRERERERERENERESMPDRVFGRRSMLTPPLMPLPSALLSGSCVCHRHNLHAGRTCVPCTCWRSTAC